MAHVQFSNDQKHIVQGEYEDMHDDYRAYTAPVLDGFALVAYVELRC